MSEKKAVEVTTLEDVIDKVLAQMHEDEANSEEFAVMTDQLEKLYKMKASERGNRPSADAVLAVAGNLAGIVCILGFERVNVVTSKALSFVLKSKL